MVDQRRVDLRAALAGRASKPPLLMGWQPKTFDPSTPWAIAGLRRVARVEEFYLFNKILRII